MSLGESTWRDVSGFVIMAATMAALARRALPQVWSPFRLRGVIAASIAFVTVLAANETGVLRTIHEDFFNRVGREFDEMSTWLVAFGGAGMAVAVGRVLRRARSGAGRTGSSRR